MNCSSTWTGTMPGILPMKVIKIGTSAQSRIAQACDRCRSKKIRCDGITPCCSQCLNVGFECKTSDKLSRRAFPRGYTESLEERVRALETEVKELKDLLDEKDEKIDVLSRARPRAPSQKPTSLIKSAALEDVKPVVHKEEPKEDIIFSVQQSPDLFRDENHDPFFMGASSGSTFVDAFRVAAQQSGKSFNSIRVETFFAMNGRSKVGYKNSPVPTISKEPARLISDQLITIFFQEWAPLFPVLHQPSFLNLYNKYVNNPEALVNQQSIALLNLVFSIAAISAEWNRQSPREFESRWEPVIDSVSRKSTLATLQCLVLAQMYCIQKGDYDNLCRYKGIAIGLTHRLGLHQKQSHFSLGSLNSETRKRIFWTQYTLDCFSAAILGLPKLMSESNIHTEYPANIDDQNEPDSAFQFTLPGGSTDVSSAVALFRVTRIMARVLDEIYPAASSHKLSLGKTNVLSNELDIWLQSLDPHHRLQFVQDKPSTSVVGGRSPFLSLAYHYVRVLIHRPAVGSHLGAKASSSVVAVASSSKHIVQILQLLEERRMSFSFCLNRSQLLVLSGFGLLFQGAELNRKGKLIQDSQKLMYSIIELLERRNVAGVHDLKRLACAMVSMPKVSKAVRMSGSEASSQRKSESAVAIPPSNANLPRKQLQVLAARISQARSDATKQRKTDSPQSAASRPTIHNTIFYARSDSQHSISSIISDPVMQRPYSQAINQNASPGQIGQLDPPNLDYLSFDDDSYAASFTSPTIPVHQSGKLYTEQLAGYVATQHPYNSQLHLTEMLPTNNSSSPSSVCYEWPSDIWALSSAVNSNPAPTHSVLSFSEEEVTSGKELGNRETGRNLEGVIMPSVEFHGRLEDYESFGL